MEIYYKYKMRNTKIREIMKKRENFIIRNSKAGMEMVQAGLLVAIAVVLGLLFKTELVKFVENTFSSLNSAGF